MRRRAGALRFGLWIAAGVLLVDQASKQLAEAVLLPYRPVELLPLLDLTLGYNTGAAFSLLADQSGWQRWFFVVLAVGVSVYLVWWLRGLAPGRRLEAAGLGLLLGGAVGNLVDRLWHGAVVDFIDVHYGGWHWPAFNVADSGITVGVLVLFVSAVRDWRRGE